MLGSNSRTALSMTASATIKVARLNQTMRKVRRTSTESYLGGTGSTEPILSSLSTSTALEQYYVELLLRVQGFNLKLNRLGNKRLELGEAG
jgi:hypothetical protein